MEIKMQERDVDEEQDSIASDWYQHFVVDV